MKRLIKYILLTLTASLALSAVSCNKEEPSFTMQAVVLAIDDKIDVDVTEAEYASGLYRIITGESTEYYDKYGKKLTRGDINVGDTIVITYNGQVMMSYPAQVVALNIVVID